MTSQLLDSFFLHAIVLLFLATTCSAMVFDNKPCRSDCLRTAMFNGHDEDYSLINHVIARFKVQSSLDCMRFCIEDHRCESFNCEYLDNNPNINCELSDATKLTAPSFYVKRPGYKYHDAIGAGDGWCNSVCSSLYKSSICPLGFTGLGCRIAMKSCKDWQIQGFTQDGIYFLHLHNQNVSLPVYCDQTTDGGGWTVFQRRQDGSVNFFRNWIEYKTGFGNLSGEFWLGNNIIHALNSEGLNELRVDLENFDGAKAFAKYRNFTVLSEIKNYTLLISGYSGSAGDSLGTTKDSIVKTVSNGMQFSTLDRDHDKWVAGSCADFKRGAWWFNDCYWSHLNGPYKEKGQSDGIDWYSWFAANYKTLKRSEMKIRPFAA